jgi:YD repeat-containing protein
MKCSSQKMNQQSTSDQPFEQHQPSLQTNRKILSNLITWLSKIGNLFVSSLEKSEEIRIRQRVDRNGQVWWYAYNPRTKRSGVFDSESEVRAWLERQYHS